MMTSVEEVLQTLETLGTEQARKTYMRHGVKGPLYGVSYADQNKLAKKLKTNHSLAVALWDSKNHDARILAMMIADPKQASSTLLDAWVADLNDYIVTDALSVYVGKTPLAREKMETWTQSPKEWVGSVGWNVLASLAKNDQTLTDAYLVPYIRTIERDIHVSQNRIRYAMNNALIAIGIRDATLEQKAIDAATHIGKVIVDHGDTGCKTRDAAVSIKKANARTVEKV